MDANPLINESIGARWIATGDGPLMQHTSLRVVDGVIAELIPNGQASADRDLGDVLLTPRWINAHTHLEFSHLERPLGSPGMAITDWIPLLIQDRIDNGASALNSIKQGLVECGETGTIALGEIATTPWYRDLPDDVRWNSILLTAFVERLGNQPDQNSAKVVALKDWLNFGITDGFSFEWQGGISPHAPYSTNFDLFQELVQYASSADLPVAMHLAESLEELRYLKTGTGRFANLLQRLNATPPKWQSRTIMDYLQVMSRLNRSLVVHGNYLTQSELDFIARHNSFHVVFCPRTHFFFEHEPYPLSEIRKRGINLAVGTDSRASNPDLNLLLELRQLASQNPGVPANEVLRFGTLNGAKALGIGSLLGSLSVGKRAQYLTFPIADDRQPLESLFRG